MRQAIIHATLIDVVVLLPIFFIGGLSGAFFQPLAIVLWVGGAGFDGGRADGHAGAVLLLLAKAPIERREPPLVRWLQRIYAPVLDADHPATAPVFARHRR